MMLCAAALAAAFFLRCLFSLRWGSWCLAFSSRGGALGVASSLNVAIFKENEKK